VNVSRIDLADAGSPEKLVMELLKAEPNLPIPVPIESLARQLDIQDIQPLTTDGFEGGLITDDARSSGIILCNMRSPSKRRRFTIGHELGHFLMPLHIPLKGGQFLCRLDDMYSLARDEQDRRLRMEAEANRFASLVLLPPQRFRRDVEASRDPDLQHVIGLSNQYDVSREATGRAYVTYRDEPAALVVVHARRILRFYKNLKFPFLTISRNAPVPTTSLLNRERLEVGVASGIKVCDPAEWIEVSRARKAPRMFEQALLQRMDYALILLHIETDNEDKNEDEDYDPDERRTSKERLRSRRGW
jgi:Zn-dependent peptidase ImmA (M78 family)